MQAQRNYTAGEQQESSVSFSAFPSLSLYDFSRRSDASCVDDISHVLAYFFAALCSCTDIHAYMAHATWVRAAVVCTDAIQPE